MAFEGLSEKLNATFKHLRGKGRLSEEDIKLAMREVRLALLEADVSYKVVKDFVKTVSERAVGAEVLDSLTPAQQVIKIVSEELTALMGGANAKLTFASKPPTVVMMVGLQGAGKTTNVAKLAGYFRKQGHRPLLTACDVYRPAAITQLQVVGKQLNIPVFEMGQIDPVQIAQEAVKYAGDHGNDMVFLDTAGRLHIDEALMDELKCIISKNILHIPGWRNPRIAGDPHVQVGDQIRQHEPFDCVFYCRHIIERDFDQAPWHSFAKTLQDFRRLLWFLCNRPMCGCGFLMSCRKRQSEKAWKKFPFLLVRPAVLSVWK